MHFSGEHEDDNREGQDSSEAYEDEEISTASLSR
jgi:hypothetical protein